MSGSIASKSSSKKIDDTKEGGCAALGKAMYAIFVAPLAYCFTRTVIGEPTPPRPRAVSCTYSGA